VSKVTFVSLMPRPIREIMPGVNPDTYKLPAAKLGDFEILHVDDGSYYIYRLDGEQLLVSEGGEKIAASLMNMIINSQLAVEADARPGVFFVPDWLAKDDIKKKYPEVIKKAEEFQRKWLSKLVEMADDMWTRTHQYAAISNLQRDAARYLGEDREWAGVLHNAKPELCPACRTTLKVGALVCLACHTIVRPDEYKKLGLTQVGK
jgi:hypothetical protein